MNCPLIVQHSFGEVGGGGPIGALSRLIESDLGDQFRFERLHQPGALGGVSLRLLLRWRKQLRRAEPDLIHVRGLGNEGFHGVVAARLAGCKPVLLSIHGTHRDLSGPTTLRRRVIVGVLERLSLRLATHVATVCEAMAQRPFVQRYERKFVGSLVNGVPFTERGPVHAIRKDVFNASPEDVVVIVVGRLARDKGHGDLADALGQISSNVIERIVLVVVGDGPDRLEVQCGYQQVDVRVVFTGRRSDVPDLLDAADIFVLPSWHENLSNALLEAMAASLPVIATAVGGNTEVVRGGGVLVRKSDSRGLATALSQLTVDSDMRQRLGVRARRVVENGYTIKHMEESVRRVYEKILSESR